MGKIHLCLFSTLLFFLISCDKNEIDIPEITMNEITDITPYSAKSKVSIKHTSSDENLVAKGICWNTVENPKIKHPFYTVSNSENSSFTIDINNLRANTTYYVRSFIISNTDTIYGNQLEFTTSDYLVFNPTIKYGSVTDIDGNEYKTVTIGNQTWMAENLKVTHFRNGDPIENITDIDEWSLNYSKPCYAWLNNDISNKDVYGAYYNWSAASDQRNIAPEGWRVPTDKDWEELFKHVNQNPFALMETTTAHWNFGDYTYLNINSSGFTAISTNIGGIVQHKYSRDSWTVFWSGSMADDFGIGAFIGFGEVYSSTYQLNHGYAIRCIKE